MLHKMNIGGLAMDPSSNAPILILNAEDEDFSIPIWIGLLEAASIASVLQDISFDRPMTHDLFKNFIVSDYYIFKSLIFAQVSLSNEEYKLYRRIKIS